MLRIFYCYKNQYTDPSLSLSNSTRSASPKAPSEFPTPKPIPDGEILERVTSIARSMKRRRELPSQKNMVSVTVIPYVTKVIISFWVFSDPIGHWCRSDLGLSPCDVHHVIVLISSRDSFVFSPQKKTVFVLHLLPAGQIQVQATLTILLKV